MKKTLMIIGILLLIIALPFSSMVMETMITEFCVLGARIT